MLSLMTKKSMREDGRVLFQVLRIIPKNGAISVKSLFSQLEPDMQEAVCEAHGGLFGFLQKRRQLFVLKANPSDNVLYVAATPLAQKQYQIREEQKETIKNIMGIPKAGAPPAGRGGFGRGMRGRGGGGGGRGRGGGGGGYGRR